MTNVRSAVRLLSLFLFALLSSAAVPASADAGPDDYFGIRVVDADTGRGVPLVELRTTYEASYYTDSNGYIAFFEPELMNREVWFDIASWGYESPEGPYGTRGVALQTTPGTIKTIKIKRRNIAERLYRQTGYGIYRDTLLLGKKPPLDRPLLDAQVTGSDTVQTAIYKDKMRWFWQDTDRVGFALGNFSMTGATTPLPDRLDPDVGMPFDYFEREPNGFAKEMARVEQEGSLPIWVDGLMVVWDADGNERLVSRYAAANKDFSIAHAGLMVYDDEQDLFVELKRIPNHDKTRLYPTQHPVRANVDGNEYYYIGQPPVVRVKADYESVTDLSAYEGLTCYTADGSLDRGENGRPRFAWRRGVEPISRDQIKRLISAGELKPEEAPFALTDVETGEPVRVATGSIGWNPFLEKWTLVFCQQGGDSYLGEVWFATANAPEGPWVACRKVATHARDRQDMDLYNVKQHPPLMREGGRYVYFEGTFVNTFSNSDVTVPYYNYNQLMYRLDLSDPRLKLPEPPPGLSNAGPSSVFVWGQSDD